MKEVKDYLKLIKGAYNEDIQEDISYAIEYFFDYVKRNSLDPNNSEDFMLFVDTVKEVFGLECELFNISKKDLDIDFTVSSDHSGVFKYNRYYDKKKKKYVDDTAIVFIDLDVSLDFLSGDVSGRLHACKGVFKTLLHEISHYLQYKRFTSNFSSPDNLMFVKEFLFSDEIKDDDLIKIYDSNHDAFSIESDARKKASQRISDYLEFRKEDNIEDVRVRAVDYILADIISDGRVYNREDYINYKANDIISRNLYLLEKFPILKKEYNSDGSRKDITSLISNMYKELAKLNELKIDENDRAFLINDTVNMYYDLIFRRLKEGNEVEISDTINVVGSDNFKILLDSISEYYRQQRINKSNLSKRKFDIRSKSNAKKGYNSPLNNYLVYASTPKGTMALPRKYFVNMYVGEYSKNIINRISRHGYFILHDGTKIGCKEFFDRYLIPEVGENPTTDDVINTMMKYAKSYPEMDYSVELEKINAEYQEKRSVIDNAIEKYIVHVERMM